MTLADNKRSIVASLLLVLFLTLQGGRMLCYHTHVFGNTVISHSHPFNNSDRQHSSSELESISVIDVCALDDNIEVLSELTTPQFPCEKIIECCPAKITSGIHQYLNGRAPPFMNII